MKLTINQKATPKQITDPFAAVEHEKKQRQVKNGTAKPNRTVSPEFAAAVRDQKRITIGTPAAPANSDAQNTPQQTTQVVPPKRGFSLPNSVRVDTTQQTSTSGGPVAASNTGSTGTARADGRGEADRLRDHEADAAQDETAAPVDKFVHDTQPDLLAPASAEQFKANINFLRDKFEHKEQMIPVIRRIMIDLNDNPEFEEFLAPEDVGLMVELLRGTYNIAYEAAAKKKRPKKSSGAEATVDLDDLMKMVL